MKVKVMRKFRDRHTGVIHQRGEVLEITETRYNEIASVGKFVYKFAENEAVSPASSDVINPSDEAENPVKTASAPSDDGFEAMSMRELKEYADKTYKMTFGRGTKKAEIIEALRRMEHGK